MKKCKMLHVNDGNWNELHNGDRLFIEECPSAEKELEKWVNDGWEVKNMVSQYTPGVQGEEGSCSFYLSGVIFYLEKEV